MKNVFLTALLFSLALTSCSDKKEVESVEATTETNVMLDEPKPVDSAAIAANATPASAEEEGLKLIEGTDCLSCHKTDSKLVGPSYQDVANKYTEADIDHLAQKIIDGGKGVWGDIPMTPHAGMSKENAQKMVKYILSLKK
ncbi:c-type cytochrome [Chryseobacterium oryctis]|uniref:C-type cytochrome n=1 Tax=Chryseobacterium oryctis TaxID=2952618 RepID=A0ABT3HPA5_9FLAO|nr:c-type cytochrome [Chryseobacterium oryctis]MCW3161619.1 c-type cytochrome [Chryseobacterium oryctis]